MYCSKNQVSGYNSLSARRRKYKRWHSVPLISLDQPIGQDSDGNVEITPMQQISTGDMIEPLENGITARAIFEKADLSQKERYVLWNYLIGKRQKEIAKSLGTSQVTVSRMIRRAIKKCANGRDLSLIF